MCPLSHSIPEVTPHQVQVPSWLLTFVVQSLSRVRLFLTPWTAAPRLPSPSLSPWACWNSCPLSQWGHPTISSSVVPFSSCPQFFPSSGSFPLSQLFASGGQSIGASASVLTTSFQVVVARNVHEATAELQAPLGLLSPPVRDLKKVVLLGCWFQGNMLEETLQGSCLRNSLPLPFTLKTHGKPWQTAPLRTLWFPGGATAPWEEAAEGNSPGVRVPRQGTFSSSSSPERAPILDAGGFMEPSGGCAWIGRSCSRLQGTRHQSPQGFCNSFW